jgi:hypothetical protein
MSQPPSHLFVAESQLTADETRPVRLRSDRHQAATSRQRRRRGPSAAVVRRRRRYAGGLAALALVTTLVLMAWRLGEGQSNAVATADLVAVPRISVAPTPAGKPAVVTTKPVAVVPPKPAAVGRIALSAVPPAGSGKLVTVPGSSAAPGNGRVQRVRVRIEEGLAAKMGIDPQAFANFVLATLNDSRSWGHGGVMTFARTDSSADFDVELATGATVDRLCLPLLTYGRVSCGWAGSRAVLNADRWADGTAEFSNIVGYRQYLINHEVGHVLGHHHEYCGGAGQLAPVMQQQTKAVAPCRPNYWPVP